LESGHDDAKDYPKTHIPDVHEERQRIQNPRRLRKDSHSHSDDERGRHHLVRWRSRSRSRRRRGKEEPLEESAAKLRAEYDRGYIALGERFAVGDCTYALRPVFTTNRLGCFTDADSDDAI
jgi:hypothetical protein